MQWLTACSSPRLGRAKYISHLDLMRTFQRAFFRSGIQIRHTEGFNPSPFVSIALPLSVGYSSQCEILEFGLVGGASYEEVPARLTAAMPEGIVIHSCYPAQRPVKELSRVNYIINMEYEEGRPLEAETALSRLLGQESLVVRKKSKKANAGIHRGGPDPSDLQLEPGGAAGHHDPGCGVGGPEPGTESRTDPGGFLRDLPRSPAGFRHLPPPRGAGRGGKGVPLTGV